MSVHEEVKLKVDQYRGKIIQFMLDIVAIPSMDSQIGDVGNRIAEEMRNLGYDEVRFDVMGNIFGRIGTGEKTIIFDGIIF